MFIFKPCLLLVENNLLRSVFIVIFKDGTNIILSGLFFLRIKMFDSRVSVLNNLGDVNTESLESKICGNWQEWS